MSAVDDEEDDYNDDFEAYSGDDSRRNSVSSGSGSGNGSDHSRSPSESVRNNASEVQLEISKAHTIAAKSPHLLASSESPKSSDLQAQAEYRSTSNHKSNATSISDSDDAFNSSNIINTTAISNQNSDANKQMNLENSSKSATKIQSSFRGAKVRKNNKSNATSTNKGDKKIINSKSPDNNISNSNRNVSSEYENDYEDDLIADFEKDNSNIGDSPGKMPKGHIDKPASSQVNLETKATKIQSVYRGSKQRRNVKTSVGADVRHDRSTRKGEGTLINNSENSENVNVSTDVFQLNGSSAKDKDEINRLTGLLFKEKDEVSRLNILLSIEKDEVNRLNSLLSKEQDEVTKLNGLLTKEKDEVSRLNSLLSKEQDEVTKLNGSLTKEKDDINRLNGLLTKEQDDAAHLKNEITRGKDEISRLNGLLTKEKDDTANLKNEVTRGQEEISRLNGLLTKEQDDAANLKNEVNRGQDEISRLNDLLSKGQLESSEVLRLNTEVLRLTTLASKSAKAIEEAALYKTLISQKDAEIADLNEAIDKLKKTSGKASEANESSSEGEKVKEVSVLSDQLLAANEEIKELRLNLERLSKGTEKGTSQMSYPQTLSPSPSPSPSKIDVHRAVMHGRDASREVLLMQLEMLHLENKSLKSEIENLKDRSKLLSNNVRELFAIFGSDP